MLFYKFANIVGKVLSKLFFKLEIVGIENIPAEEGFLLCANHVHVFDPLAIGLALDRKMFFIAKKELFNNKLKHWVLTNLGGIPIDRGTNDLKAIKQSLRILKDDKILVIFPEGTRNTTGEYIEPKSGAALLAVKTKSKIVPVYIDAAKNYKLFSKVIVNIGKPIEFDEYYASKPTSEDYTYMSAEIMKCILNLRNED